VDTKIGTCTLSGSCKETFSRCTCFEKNGLKMHENDLMTLKERAA
jgi:hypothetical protein